MGEDGKETARAILHSAEREMLRSKGEWLQDFKISRMNEFFIHVCI